MYRISRYVFPVYDESDPETVIALVNTANLALLVLDEDGERELQRAIGKDPGSEHVLADLGFVVESETDERGAVRALFAKKRVADGAVQLTIAPTMACNFGCDYCFESHRKGIMPAETQEQVVEAAKALCMKAPLDQRSLSVTWFGGEPLMARPAIESMSERLNVWARTHLPDGEVRYSIITNGYLLTETVSSRLFELGIRDAQITIDGPEKIHDKRRKLKVSGKGTFYQILDNIESAPSEMQVVIRINIDQRNQASISSLLQELAARNLSERVAVSLAPVEEYSEKSGTCQIVSSPDFGALSQSLAHEGASWGLRVSGPQPQVAAHGVCQVDSKNSYVVDVNGDLYRCWASLGTGTKRVGHVSDLCRTRLAVLADGSLRSRDPFDDPECMECVFLPLCMGGCPKTRAENRLKGTKVCPSWKYTFQEKSRERVRQMEAAGGRERE